MSEERDKATGIDARRRLEEGTAPPTGPRRFGRIVNIRDPLWWVANLVLILMVACHAWLGIIYIGAIADPEAEAAELRLATLPDFLLNAATVDAKAGAQAAIDRLQPAADAGDADAQYRIARTLLWEPGAIGRACEGLRWLDRAARGGHPAAQYDLARAYRGGFGVSRDASLAYRWALKASQAGHALAKAELPRFAESQSRVDPAASEQSLAQPPPAFILPLPQFEILLWFSRLYLDADSCAAFPANP